MDASCIIGQSSASPKVAVAFRYTIWPCVIANSKTVPLFSKVGSFIYQQATTVVTWRDVFARCVALKKRSRVFYSNPLMFSSLSTISTDRWNHKQPIRVLVVYTVGLRGRGFWLLVVSPFFLSLGTKWTAPKMAPSNLRLCLFSQGRPKV